MLFTWSSHRRPRPGPHFDGSFREDDQSADEVARDISTEPMPTRWRLQRRPALKDSDRALQRNKNTDDQHEVAAHLRNRTCRSVPPLLLKTG
jgi:hypothetical protein